MSRIRSLYHASGMDREIVRELLADPDRFLRDLEYGSKVAGEALCGEGRERWRYLRRNALALLRVAQTQASQERW